MIRFTSGRFTALVLAGLSLSLAVIGGCESTDNNKAEFDRKAMLVHFADSLIIPSYQRLETAAELLSLAADSFVTATDSNRLFTLQNAWDKTYSAWMYANAYNFGPGGEEGISKSAVEEIGTWPANTTLIESNISTGNSSLNDFNRDNRGLNAIDYLIHDLNGNLNTILNAFRADPKRGTYLKAVATKLHTQTKNIAEGWSSYRAAFISSDGSSVGSSASLMYNEFVKSFENLKNFKVGLPLGLRAGQTGTEPSKVEARYSGKSRKYLELHWKALENIWYGRSMHGYDGTGWKEYLAFVTGGNELISRTEAQMSLINAAFATLADAPSMEAQIGSRFAAWESLHTELQKHTRLFKSDMSSLLGIAITYSSGDGD